MGASRDSTGEGDKGNQVRTDVPAPAGGSPQARATGPPAPGATPGLISNKDQQVPFTKIPGFVAGGKVTSSVRAPGPTPLG